jgi:integrase
VRGRAGLGQPLAGDVLAAAMDRIGASAGVKRITFHGIRHTAATLLLSGGIPPHVVAKRLGHSPAVLMETYAHVLRADSREAALLLGGLLHG